MSVEFPRKKLSEVVFFQEGPGLRNWQWTDTGMKVINVTNLLGDEAFSVDTTNTDKYISLIEFEEKYSHFEVDDGDYVVASSGNTYGKVGKITERNLPLMMNTSVIRFRSLDQDVLDDRYLFCFLRSKDFRGQVDSFVTGGAQPNFGPTHLKKMDIPVPELVVQQKIGSIVGEYDDLIENNRRRIQLLEESARLLYKEWFVQLRFPGHEHVKIFDGVPEGWARVKLADCADLTMGQSPQSEFYNDVGEGLPFHQGVTNYGFRFAEHKTYCTKVTRIAEAGDILCSVRAPVGRLNITLDKMILGRGLAAIRAKSGHQSFLFYTLRSFFFKEDIMGSGAIFASVTKKDMENIELLTPPLTLEQQFEEFASEMDSQIANLTRQNKQLAEARDILLPRLMNGELAA